MEKFGVELDDEKTKQAGFTITCESCGKSFEPKGISGWPRCPHCGSTKQFEKRPEKK